MGRTSARGPGATGARHRGATALDNAALFLALFVGNDLAPGLGRAAGGAWRAVTLRGARGGLRDVLGGLGEVAAGAAGTVAALLLAATSRYRPLTPQERADARRVYGEAIDLDLVSVSLPSLANDVVFAVQRRVRRRRSSRAFVTNTLINCDPAEALPRHTLVHELAHVWQALTAGPSFMAEALHAQLLGGGYNYGYREGEATVEVPVDLRGTRRRLDAGRATGLGGEAALAAAGADLGRFNREQQAQILMHYFVRRFLLELPEPAWAAWRPYAEAVRARPGRRAPRLRPAARRRARSPGQGGEAAAG